MEKVVQSQNLNFNFGHQPVIRALNLNVPANSIYGFLGPNGAGKSTTIKLLLGLLQNPEDNIQLFDKSIKSHKYEILANIGNMIDEPTVYRHLTGYENLKYMDWIFKMGKERIREVLKVIGLWEHRNKEVKHYSTGMKQRLGIGMAIFHNPELLILDEPLSGLDPVGVYEMRQLMKQLHEEGKTIFVSSHILSEVEQLCTHVGIIYQGRMLFQGEMAELTAQNKKQVNVKTDDAKNALNAFRQCKIQPLSADGQWLTFELNEGKDFHEVARFMVEHNITIKDVSNEPDSLENIFMNLISG